MIPLRGRTQKASNADSGTPGNGRGKKAASTKSASASNKQTSKTDGTKSRGRSKKSRGKDTASSQMSINWQKNAPLILDTLEKWFYFCRPTNLAFHNLTIGKVAPKALQLLLGLGVNFCPTPLRPTLNINKSMERFERDLHICSVFAGSEDIIPLANPKIYVR